MDAHYNFEGAKNSLRTFIAERHLNDTYQLTNFDDVHKLEPVLNEKPTYWRFTIPTAEAGQSEELVLSMQGVIVTKDLPPVLKKPDDQQQRYLRQSVQLTGFDCEEFQTSINTLRRLHQMFTRQVPEGCMEPFALGQFHHFDTVEFATRYFTSRRDDPNGTALPFDRSTDPNGVLSGMSDNKYFHGEDNKVLYYVLKSVDDKSHPRFFEVDPMQFRAGDIVEAQITIVAVPTRNNKFKMFSQLRCLALLDGTFTDDVKWKMATTNRLRATVQTRGLKPAIKRKVGYETADDDVSEARKKMVNMTMNDH